VPDVIPLGSSDMEHVIEVENGSTIDYDFHIETQLRNSSSNPPLEFEYNNKKGTGWTADISPLCPSICDSRAAKITCLATTACIVVADTAKIEYREDASHKWQEDLNPTKKVRLSISLK
jgi:hypothetical protein